MGQTAWSVRSTTTEVTVWRAALPLVLVGCASASASIHQRFDREYAPQLAPLTAEAIRFPTVAGNGSAYAAEKTWLIATARVLGLEARDAGPVVEIELPGPPGAPVLGLAAHGDVQPVDASMWTVAPFDGAIRNGYVIGRGAADDKGPIVQAMLVMSALRSERRTHTIRLLVGSDEESGMHDMVAYLESHAAPAYTLVLDAFFPVVIGEKSFVSFAVTAPAADDGVELEAGSSGAIVPAIARLTIHSPAPGLADKLRARRPDPGTRIDVVETGDVLTATMYGRAAHSGVNIEHGRNAIVSLARFTDGLVPDSSAGQLLEFARAVGVDLYASALGLPAGEPPWGRTPVNVAMVSRTFKAPELAGRPTLLITLRRSPTPNADELRARLEHAVATFDTRTGAKLEGHVAPIHEPLAIDPHGKLVRRLLTIYRRATGLTAAEPVVVGGGTYAKVLPHAIAFGMWFTGEPFPGHDADEKIAIAGLRRGAHVLLDALLDLSRGPPLVDPFAP